MSINRNPAFIEHVISKCVQLTAANTNRDGTGTIVDALTGGSVGGNGSRVHRITVKAVGTTTPGMIRLYRYIGAAYRLIKEIPVDAIVPSGTVESFEHVLDLQNEDAWMIAKDEKLAGSTHNTETFNLFVECGDY